MMTRQERAKQFMAFDAMKGLKEALLDREERHSRVERRYISEEQIEKNSEVIVKLYKGCKVEIEYFHNFHEVYKTGFITEVVIPKKYLKLGETKIVFDDIYSIFLSM